MNYLEHTTILKKQNAEYKHVRLQKYDDNSHATTNKFYIDERLVCRHERYMCESEIDQASYSRLVNTTREWVK